LSLLPDLSVYLSLDIGMLTEILSLGRTPTLVVSSAEAARAVLKTHDLDCCCRPRLSGSGRLTYNHVYVAFAPYGDYWWEMRKLFVLEPFILKRVQSFRFITGEVARIMNSIPQSSSPATPVYLTVMLYSLLASAVLRIDFGKSFKEVILIMKDFDKWFMKLRQYWDACTFPMQVEFLTRLQIIMQELNEFSIHEPMTLLLLIELRFSRLLDLSLYVGWVAPIWSRVLLLYIVWKKA